MYKQIIVIRTDIKMSKGKTAVQSAHASLLAAKKADPKIRKMWETFGQKKVVLKAENEKELLRIKKECDGMRIINELVSDAGLTELEPGTVTALGIGPDEEEKIDKVTGKLKML